MGCGVWGVGCGVWGAGCGVWGAGCGGCKIRDKGLLENNMITIREASVDDAKTIIYFQQQMAIETEGLSLDGMVLNGGVMAVFDDPLKGRYFVADNDGTVIASLLITYEWSDWRNSYVWWFQSVYVLPDYRRRGIFRSMYAYIRDQADLKGAAGLRLYVESNNATARKTYEALGMTSEHYTMYEWLREN